MLIYISETCNIICFWEERTVHLSFCLIMPDFQGCIVYVHLCSFSCRGKIFRLQNILWAKFAVYFNTVLQFASSVLDGNFSFHTKSSLASIMVLKRFEYHSSQFGWSACIINRAYLQILIHRWASKMELFRKHWRNSEPNKLQTQTFPTIIISWLISWNISVLVKKEIVNLTGKTTQICFNVRKSQDN